VNAPDCEQNSTEQTTAKQTVNIQSNGAPVLSPSPITPISNTACSPLSVDESTAANKRSGLVAVSINLHLHLLNPMIFKP